MAVVSHRGAATLEQLYTAAACRELDRLAIAAGQAGIELMRRAGRAVFDELLSGWPRLRGLTICCGKGNNAGDGYVVADLALAQGLTVQLIQIGDPADLTGDAATARDDALARGLTVTRSDAGDLRPRGDVIVDALLGTGLRGPAAGPYARLIEEMNDSGLPIVAVDVPSGVHANTGAIAGAAVRADVTVTFIGRKIGLYTGAGAELAGRVSFAGLGVGREVHEQVAGLDWLSFDDVVLRHGLPRRGRDAYKQALGHIAVIGGDHSMGGAPLMTAEAALRTGAGMVTVITRAGHRTAILSRRPEIMVVDADDQEQRDGALARATALVVGPGLGRGDWGARLLALALAEAKPMVIDADGLFLLAASGSIPQAATIITPHTGEAATLLGCSSEDIQHDRLAAVMELAERVSGVALLKGAGTVVSSVLPASPGICLGVCRHGNPGMATAGMGDVLAGVIGSLVAQGLPAEAAASVGVCLHSLAGDRAALRIGEAGLLATDLYPELAELLKMAARPSSALEH